ncbi:MAG: hypothetical protein AAGK22_22115 [Acidobacteriota bacterium]
MSFLFLSTPQALMLIAAALGAVVAIYLLKPPPLPLQVASTRLWERVLEERDDRRELWRYLLSLFLALVIAGLLAAALAGLQPGSADELEPTFLVIDNSPSSATLTRSGATRLERGIEIARRILSESAGEVLVADTAGQLGGLAYSSRGEAERRLDRISAQTSDRLRFPTSLAPASSPAPPAVHFITDGVSNLEAPQGTVVHSVFEPAVNVGISAFGARDSTADRDTLQAAIEVVNGSLTAQRPRLEVRADGDLLIDRPVELAAGEAWSASINLSEHVGKRIDARIVNDEDALPSDDEASFEALGTPEKPKVALVGSSGRPAVELLLETTGLDIVDPAEANLIVALGGPLTAERDLPTLHLAPESYPQGEAQRREVQAPLERSETAPLLLDRVAWQGLRPRLLAPPEEFRLSLAEGSGSTEAQLLLSAGSVPVLWTERNDRVVLTAELETELVSQTFFPEFFEASLSWLSGRAVAASDYDVLDRHPFVNRTALATMTDEATETAEEAATGAPAYRLWRMLLTAACLLLALQAITAARKVTV